MAGLSKKLTVVLAGKTGTILLVITNFGAANMEWLLIFKTLFFLTWPILLIGAIIFTKKHRSKKGKGRSIWNH